MILWVVMYVCLSNCINCVRCYNMLRTSACLAVVIITFSICVSYLALLSSSVYTNKLSFVCNTLNHHNLLAHCPPLGIMRTPWLFGRNPVALRPSSTRPGKVFSDPMSALILQAYL